MFPPQLVLVNSLQASAKLLLKLICFLNITKKNIVDR
jgi:hypothetical protein